MQFPIFYLCIVNIIVVSLAASYLGQAERIFSIGYVPPFGRKTGWENSSHSALDGVETEPFYTPVVLKGFAHWKYTYVPKANIYLKQVPGLESLHFQKPVESSVLILVFQKHDTDYPMTHWLRTNLE